jgi:hypothetical protein
MIILEPCALNADFQHFIPRLSKISLLYGYTIERKVWNERRPTDKVTLQINFSIYSYTYTSKNIDTGRA